MFLTDCWNFDFLLILLYMYREFRSLGSFVKFLRFFKVQPKNLMNASKNKSVKKMQAPFYYLF